MKRVMSTMLFGLLVLALLTAPVIAQDQPAATTLSYESQVSGTIDDANNLNIWPLEITGLDRITIEAERTSGNLLPDLILRDPNGDQVAQSFGTDNTGAAAQMDNIRLANTGIYEVVVQRVDGETGLTSGDYSLSVTLLASGEERAPNAASIAPIEYNTFVEGRITPEHWLHRYTLTASAADFIQVSAVRNAGTLMPEVEVLDSLGNSLRTGFTEGTGDFATLTFDLPRPDEYTIVITRARRYQGATFGSYRLTLDLIGGGEGNPILDAVQGNIEYDTPLIGELVDGQWYQDWVLQVDAGDVITITARRPLDAATEASNLVPEVLLLGGSGQELRRGFVDDSGAQAVISRFDLNVPGEYIVRVTRERQKNGFTSGSYVLTVGLDGGGPGGPTMRDTTGSVLVGTPVDGEITHSRWADSWDFNAEAGQRVDIRVVRSGGTLIPRIDIQDANGQSLRTVFPNRGRDNAEILGYTFPSKSAYRIVVLRDSEETGYTTGGYRLSVTMTP